MFCEDYMLTVDQMSRVELYHLPHINNIFTVLSRILYFSKLDLSKAYL